MRTKTEHNQSIVFYLAATFLGIAVAFLGVLLSAVWIVKNDTNYEKYVFFLFISAFIGAFIAGFITSKKQARKRFLVSVGQGSVIGTFFLLILCAVNGFSVSPLSIIVLPCAIAGGAGAGLITSSVR